MKLCFSLSGLVKGILRNQIQLSDVEVIYSGTALKDEESIERWIKEYILPLTNASYEDAKKVTKEIFESGKLYQMRLMGYGDDIYNPFRVLMTKEEALVEYQRIKRAIEGSLNSKRFIWADDLLKLKLS